MKSILPCVERTTNTMLFYKMSTTDLIVVNMTVESWIQSSRLLLEGNRYFQTSPDFFQSPSSDGLKCLFSSFKLVGEKFAMPVDPNGGSKEAS